MEINIFPPPLPKKIHQQSNHPSPACSDVIMHHGFGGEKREKERMGWEGEGEGRERKNGLEKRGRRGREEGKGERQRGKGR